MLHRLLPCITRNQTKPQQASFHHLYLLLTFSLRSTGAAVVEKFVVTVCVKGVKCMSLPVNTLPSVTTRTLALESARALFCWETQSKLAITARLPDHCTHSINTFRSLSGYILNYFQCDQVSTTGIILLCKQTTIFHSNHFFSIPYIYPT